MKAIYNYMEPVVIQAVVFLTHKFIVYLCFPGHWTCVSSSKVREIEWVFVISYYWTLKDHPSCQIFEGSKVHNVDVLWNLCSGAYFSSFYPKQISQILLLYTCYLLDDNLYTNPLTTNLPTTLNLIQTWSNQTAYDHDSWITITTSSTDWYQL